MTTKTICAICGMDCSNAYGTYNGYPVHFGCFPMPRPKRHRHPDAPRPPQAPPKRPQTLAEAERQWIKDNGWSSKS